jgi:hypothetical protein
MIILTNEQADQVRGLTTMGHALAPFPLTDGTFVLAEECASDPAHAKHAALLKGLPTRSVEPGEYLHSKGATDDGKPSTLTAAEAKLLADCEYKSEWTAGQLIKVVKDK